MDSIDPWDTPTDAAELLYELDAVLRRYVSMQDWARQLVCLYVVFSHCLDAFDIAPRLFITSPVRGCGKTLLLMILFRLCALAEMNSGTSRAGLYSAIDSGEAITLLLDEAQHWARKSGPLMTILDGGFTRDTAFIRLFPGGVAKKYNTFAAFIVAAIGNPFPDTFDDRCIMVPQQRSRPDEQLEDFRSDRTGHLTDLRRKLGRWALDNEAALRAADPEMPEGIRGRTADKLRPLVAIADLALGGWSEIVRAAILQSIIETDEPDDATNIIADCVRVIERHETGRIRSADLAIELRGEDRKYRNLTPKALSLLLAPFQIRPQVLRFGSQTTLHGYERSDFDEAIIRYGVDLTAPDDPTPRPTVSTETSVSRVDRKRYWLLPPALRQEWQERHHLRFAAFDPCPYPLPDGFDGLTMPWPDIAPDECILCHPPFTKNDTISTTGGGVTAWVRKCFEESRRVRGKAVAMLLPVYLGATDPLIEAGAETIHVGMPAFLSIEDGSPNPGRKLQCALYILRPAVEPDEAESEPVPWFWTFDHAEGFARTEDDAYRGLFAHRDIPYPDTRAKVDEVLDIWGDHWFVGEADIPGMSGLLERARAALAAPPSGVMPEVAPAPAETTKPPPKGRGRPPVREPERLVLWGTNRHGGRWEILCVPAGMEPGPDIRTVGGTYYTLFAARKAAKRAAKRYGMPLQDEPVEHD